MKKQEPEEVVRGSIGWARRCLDHALFQSGFPAEAPPFNKFRSHPHVGVAWFSDTVLLYTRTDTDTDAAFLTRACSWFLFETIVVAKARMRLGLAYGPLLVDEENAVHVGLSIVHANDTEKQQEWSGGALHSTAEERLGPLIDSLPVIKYTVPIKPAEIPTKKMLALSHAIDWTSEIHEVLTFAWAPQSADAPNAVRNGAADIVRKFENTRLFHEKMCAYPRCREGRGLPAYGPV
ncbi:MAG TPA: hypothetical protein VN181_12505 [Thermoanaerobaculia bacterium]|nr:hypothetical protein [Thermoanaerobaculia bacterium]